MKVIHIKIGIIALATMCICLRAAEGQTQPPKADYKIELKEYAVHQVQGKKPYKFLDKDNKLKESKTAYLITFTFDQKQKPMNVATNFYIGDYRIPEYGGTENGIYFRLIDPALLGKLNNQMIWYQISNTDRLSLKKEFVIPDIKNMKIENEENLLKSK